ncbi:MAG: hypothetical protein Q8O56_11995 [Solirubrobacteraceae bacterium]|nr:hypothetical protein [Solirubrobacteraceae bacterium]
MITAPSPRTGPATRGDRPPQAQTLVVAAGLAAAAGVIHIKAGIDHAPHWWAFGVFFGVVAYAQLGWAYAVYRGRAGERLLRVALYGSLAVTAIWLMSRTAGMPIGPWAWEPEPIAVADTVATLDQLALAALVGAWLRPSGRAGRLFGWLRGNHAVRLGMMLASASLLALAFGSHSHS